jgi:hypothetical protein
VGTNHGTLVNGATFASGEVGQAFSLDGVDDRVAIPEAPATDISRMSQWTVEAWARPTSFSGQNWPTIYSEGRWGVALGIQHGTGKLEITINNGPVYDSTVALQLNAWNHVALTHNGTNHVFYLNGAAAGSFTTTVSPDSNGAAIGDIAFNPNSSRFQGQVDEVSIYNRALGATEISGIYNAGPAGKSLASLSLDVRLTATNTVLVVWPSAPAGFILQENTDLRSTNWTISSATVNDDGTTKFILINPPAGARYYRLQR